MKPSRRTFLKTVGATAGAGALLSSASPVAAHGKPNYVWRPADSSNYTNANREADYDIRWYIIHVAEGSYSGTIDWFQNPSANASTHYVIENDSSPELTQMVDESDIAWHGGGTNYNNYSLGIEHEGWVDSTYWTDATYRKSARLAQWACETYGIPLRVRRYDVAPCDQANGAGGVIGHHQIPETDCGANDHTDPGSTWNWGKFEGYLRRYHLGVNEHAFASADLSVRDGAGTGYTRLDVAPQGTPGTVVDGPVDNDGYRWYKLDYDEGVATGWSAANWLPHSRFDIGHGTTTSTALSVRDGPGTGYSRIDTAYEGEGGVVVDGPVDNDGYRWFRVDYDSSATGWSAGFYLRH
jgi:N-acetyl-anhydromuramyl-L-alanine amidase AmpD/uncharacterized protein YraI